MAEASHRRKFVRSAGANMAAACKAAPSGRQHHKEPAPDNDFDTLTVNLPKVLLDSGILGQEAKFVRGRIHLHIRP